MHSVIDTGRAGVEATGERTAASGRPKRMATGTRDGLERAQYLLAFAWHAALLVAWVGHVRGILPFWVFALFGVSAFIRNFNAMHLLSHRAPWNPHSWVRRVLFFVLAPVSSPLGMGWRELTRAHLDHHRAATAREDPDAYLSDGPWWRGLFGALTQSEQGLVRFVLRHGGVLAVIARVAFNVVVLATLYRWGGARGLVAWLAVTRLGNMGAWFTFDWIIHRPWSWDAVGGVSAPAWFRVAWTVAFGAGNREAILHHRVHHARPSVSDEDLHETAVEESQKLSGGDPLELAPIAAR
jgi:hypothetical protein